VITIGIDPGWSSFGIGLTQGGKLLSKTSFIPKNDKTIHAFISTLDEYLTCQTLGEVEFEVYIERFVAYAGVQSSASEDILMLIGALDYYFSVNYAKPKLVKAIDWKVKVVHHLVKTKGVSNPSKSLDKKFSLWAAEQLSGEGMSSDHEADAVCLSYLKGII
jgi:hypothetical protein